MCSNAQKIFLDGKLGIPGSTSTTTPVIIRTTVVLEHHRLQTYETNKRINTHSGSTFLLTFSFMKTF
jgi:hypothetical protein